MVKVKFCGLTREADIIAVNELKPDYIGFVFAPKSRRYVSFSQAQALKTLLHNDIAAVGVFTDENPQTVADLLNKNIIDLAQLHGHEDEAYIQTLRRLTSKPIIQAFQIHSAEDIIHAQQSFADYILLDSGSGSGQTFNWQLSQKISRPYFLAGGLNSDNLQKALRLTTPYAVDVSSGIETNGVKDKSKMHTFMHLLRNT